MGCAWVGYRPRLARLSPWPPFFFLTLLSYLFRGAAWKELGPLYHSFISDDYDNKAPQMRDLCSVSAVGLDPQQGLLWALNLNGSGLCFQGPFPSWGPSRRSPWADSYTGRAPGAPRGQAKPSRSSSLTFPRGGNRGHQALLLVPCPGSIMLATCSLSAGLCQVLGNRGHSGEERAGGWWEKVVPSPQVTRHLGTLSANPVGQRPQDGRCPGEQRRV